MGECRGTCLPYPRKAFNPLAEGLGTKSRDAAKSATLTSEKQAWIDVSGFPAMGCRRKGDLGVYSFIRLRTVDGPNSAPL